jgi:hypothetical protein
VARGLLLAATLVRGCPNSKRSGEVFPSRAWVAWVADQDVSGGWWWCDACLCNASVGWTFCVWWFGCCQVLVWGGVGLLDSRVPVCSGGVLFSGGAGGLCGSRRVGVMLRGRVLITGPGVILGLDDN